MNPVLAIKGKSCTPAPVILNGWKHHQGFLILQIQKWASAHERTFPLFIAKLKMLGDSQFDLYTGKMSPEEIVHDLTTTLKGFKAYEFDSYTRWIESSTQLFWQLSVSDDSEWTLRKGDSEDFYIHIHPARYSKHTQRFKANPLRTALATLIMANMRHEKPGLQLMNEVRRNYLALSDVTKPMAKEIFSFLNHFARIADVPH